MKLREIAYSRCGDKGDTSNVCVFPYRAADWPWLRRWLTAERVRDAYAAVVSGEVHRYELDRLGGLNFVLEHALGGGAASSLRLDGFGKCMQSLVLDLEVTEPGPLGRPASDSGAAGTSSVSS
jgi:hypothetical protein